MATIALQAAATGLSALNTKLDVIANNLANVNTTGFKGSRTNFQDLLYIERSQPGSENANGDRSPTGLFVGLGVKVSGTQTDMRQGDVINTQRDLDVLIDGIGFFKVKVEDSLGNGTAYTRAGNFILNKDGELCLATNQGRRIQPIITIPSDVVGPVKITSDGKIQYLQPGQTRSEEHTPE